MDEAKLIAEIGHALWGEQWQGPMADALERQKKTVRDWRRGHMPVPPGVWNQLIVMAQLRRDEAGHLELRIRSAHDAAVSREAARVEARSHQGPKREI